MSGKGSLWFIAVSLVLVLAAGIVSAAPVTQSISFQGNLTNAAGTPLSGTYSVTFRLYNVATGGTALATDTHAVTAARGLYTTTLNFPARINNGQGLWVGVQRSPDPEKTPRSVLRPVPYALSLRPGAVVAGSGAPPVLKLVKSVDRGEALNVTTSGDDSEGLIVSTSGYDSTAVQAYTSAYDTTGVEVFTMQDHSEGVIAHTAGDQSCAMSVQTDGRWSPGMEVLTWKDGSNGVRIYTYGAGSEGVWAYTSGPGSAGVYGISERDIGVRGNGTDAAGVHGYSTNKAGVWGLSENDVGVYGETSRPDHMYGVMTRDFMSAARYDTNAGDVAEYMDVDQHVPPGTVMVIRDDGKLTISTAANDTRVAGIVSTTPGLALGTEEGGNPGEEIVAVAGRVPCRVDAGCGAIHAGDLLTTSPNPGFAMKAEPVEIGGIRIYRPGTIIGKAMGSLESGTGTIEVLVTLQ